MGIYYIEQVYLMPYVYSFCQIFQALRLFPTLRLLGTLEYAYGYVRLHLFGLLGNQYRSLLICPDNYGIRALIQICT